MMFSRFERSDDDDDDMGRWLDIIVSPRQCDESDDEPKPIDPTSSFGPVVRVVVQAFNWPPNTNPQKKKSSNNLEITPSPVHSHCTLIAHEGEGGGIKSERLLLAQELMILDVCEKT